MGRPDSARVGPVRDRHQPCSSGANLRLLPQREEQLRRRPGSRRAADEGPARDQAGGERQPAVPAAGSALCGAGGRYPPVPGHRNRNPGAGEYPPGRASAGPDVHRRVCRQRPDGAGALPGAAGRRRTRPDHDHPGRPAGTGRAPRPSRGARGGRLRPAGRAHAGRGAALHRRRGGPRRDRGDAAAGPGARQPGHHQPRRLHRGPARRTGPVQRGLQQGLLQHPHPQALRGAAVLRGLRPGRAGPRPGLGLAAGPRHRAAAAPGRVRGRRRLAGGGARGLVGAGPLGLPRLLRLPLSAAFEYDLAELGAPWKILPERPLVPFSPSHQSSHRTG